MDRSTTLDDIQQRGVLNCGVVVAPGFVEQPTSDTFVGIDVDLCRAVAAGIFGVTEEDPDEYIDYNIMTYAERWEALQSKEVDLLAASTTHTMERDVFIPQVETGFSFSTPYYYFFHAFAGVPNMVACADNMDVSEACASLKVCVADGTTTLVQLEDMIPSSNILIQPTNEEALSALLAGDCNTIYAGTNEVAEAVKEMTSQGESIVIGDVQFNHEPIALVTREDDAVFSDFVNWILQALLNAEEQDVTQSTYLEVAPSNLFGDSFAQAFRDAVRAVGNYGEVYERNLGKLVPRSGLNEINQGSTGRIIGGEFGSLDEEGPLFHTGTTLDKVKAKGFVSCGVNERAGFAEFDRATSTWSGIDVDLCRALSAAIFDGVPDHTVYHSVSASDRFRVLASGLIDVLPRLTTHTYERDVHEPTTMMGFSFSKPYFYDGLSFAGVSPYGNCADRLDVSSEECVGLKICVNEGSTTITRTRELFPEANIVPMATGKAAVEGLVSGQCNALAGGSHDIARNSVLRTGRVLDYEVGSTRYSKEPLAVVTRMDDPVWSDFVYWVVEALFIAEEQGITKDTAENMPRTDLFGGLFRDMLRNAVSAGGAYNELYSRNLEDIVPRAGLNLLNNGSQPQFYPLPGLSFE
jgi:general L-amino acid transport system substrate-binding protein